MNQGLLERFLRIAEKGDSISIFFQNRNIILHRKFIVDYQFYNRGTHLQIVMNDGSKTILIKTDSIEMVTLVKPTGKKMTWYNQGENKTTIGA